VVAVNINVEVSAAKGALDQLKLKIPRSSKKALSKTAMFLQNAIKDRTRKGRDFRGRAFRPYSPKYAKRRAKEGRTTTPNLFRSGQMLGNMTARTFSPTKAEIFLQNIKAFYNDTHGVGKAKIKREFFSVGKKEEDKAVKIFTDTIMRDLRL
jgi:hypothetical protein